MGICFVKRKGVVVTLWGSLENFTSNKEMIFSWKLSWLCCIFSTIPSIFNQHKITSLKLTETCETLDIQIIILAGVFLWSSSLVTFSYPSPLIGNMPQVLPITPTCLSQVLGNPVVALWDAPFYWQVHWVGTKLRSPQPARNRTAWMLPDFSAKLQEVLEWSL